MTVSEFETRVREAAKGQESPEDVDAANTAFALIADWTIMREALAAISKLHSEDNRLAKYYESGARRILAALRLKP